MQFFYVIVVALQFFCTSVKCRYITFLFSKRRDGVYLNSSGAPLVSFIIVIILVKV